MQLNPDLLAKLADEKLDFRMLTCLSAYEGWSYPRRASDIRVAYQSPGVPRKLVATSGYGSIDCTTFTVSIVTAAFPRAGWTFDNNASNYGDYQLMQLWEHDWLTGRPGAGIEALVRRTIVEDTLVLTHDRRAVPASMPAWAAWGVVYVYKDTADDDGNVRRSGHAVIVRRLRMAGWWGTWILYESSKSYGGFRSRAIDGLQFFLDHYDEIYLAWLKP